VDVLQSFLREIERVDPLVNAIPTLRPREDLIREARDPDRASAQRGSLGPLHGLPLAIKELTPAVSRA
jgi:amidase